LHVCTNSFALPLPFLILCARKGKESNIKLSPPLSFAWLFLKPYKATAVLSLFFVFISTGLDHVSPFVLKIVIDTLEAGLHWHSIIPWLGLMLGASLVSAVLLFFQRYMLITASRKAEYDIRNTLFERIQFQDHKFFEKYSVGDIMSRLTNDMDHFRELIGPVVLHSFRMFLLFAYTATALLIINPTLAVTGLSMAILLPFISVRFMHFMYTSYGKKQKVLAGLNSYVQEVLGGIMVIKGFSRESLFARLFHEKSAYLRDVSKKVALSVSAIWPIIAFISGLGICAVIFVGSYMVIQEQITLGDLSATVVYLVKVHFPLVGMGWVLSVIQRGRASLSRIYDLYCDMAIEPDSSLQRPTQKHFEFGEFTLLETQNLSLTLNNRLCLEDISFKLAKGKSLGIAGATGSGKTVLVQTLYGYWPATQAQLFLNGADSTSTNRSKWFQYFTLAPQEGFLFSETIADNIAFGSENAHGQEIQNKSMEAGLGQDLQNQIPGGLSAMLGEKGINLSGGQRQRVSLARALLSPAPILILDDTLSAVDAETEQFILAQLSANIGKTKIVISHRYSSLMHCDEILFLKNGKVWERGTHKELVELGGEYAAAYQTQVLESSLENLS
jgi:ATP-binding cassette, subfamily B, multidrug efflux pump